VDRRLLDLYNRELAHLRTMGAEFAKEFPKIAGRLGGLDEFQACQDPFVERLLEGFAFLAARVQLKLNAEFPRFTQSLLETIYPHFLAPTPSMCIVHFEPDLAETGLVDGFLIPRGSSLFSTLGKTDQTRCEYRTAHDVTLLPIRLIQANYYTRELPSLDIPSLAGVKAGIRIRIQSPEGLGLNKLKLDSLVLHLMGAGEIPMHLYEQFIANAVGVVIQPATKPLKWQEVIDASSIRGVGFENNQKLLPYDARSFQGYRLLHEYFAFPQRFLFVELAGLDAAIRRCDENQLDIVILFRESNIELEGTITADNFGLWIAFRYRTNSSSFILFRIERGRETLRFTGLAGWLVMGPGQTRSKSFFLFIRPKTRERATRTAIMSQTGFQGRSPRAQGHAVKDREAIQAAKFTYLWLIQPRHRTVPI
jgi:type VI secretion system protein ImpG